MALGAVAEPQKKNGPQAAGLERSVQLSVSDIHRLPPPPGDFGCVLIVSNLPNVVGYFRHVSVSHLNAVRSSETEALPHCWGNPYVGAHRGFVHERMRLRPSCASFLAHITDSLHVHPHSHSRLHSHTKSQTANAHDDRCVITNPPYGERLGGAVTANEGIGRLMGQLHDRGWGLFVLSGDETFEEQVGRTRCVRREKESLIIGQRDTARPSKSHAQILGDFVCLSSILLAPLHTCAYHASMPPLPHRCALVLTVTRSVHTAPSAASSTTANCHASCISTRVRCHVVSRPGLSQVRFKSRLAAHRARKHPNAPPARLTSERIWRRIRCKQQRCRGWQRPERRLELSEMQDAGVCEQDGVRPMRLRKAKRLGLSHVSIVGLR